MMNILLLLARLVLFMVFIVSGCAKLVDRTGSRQSMRGFGVPAVFAPALGILLPLAELAVALALLPTATAWWGAIGALTLLLLFIAGISYNLARGHTPDCHCFGQLYSRPIGWPTLIRNIVLAVLAGFIVGFSRGNSNLDLFAWLERLPQAQLIDLIVGVILFVLIALECWLLIQMLRQQGRLLVRLEALESRSAMAGTAVEAANEVQAAPVAGLSPGSQAPGFSLPGLYGEVITLDFLRASGKPVLLIFSDPDCGPCTTLLPEVGRWQREYGGKVTLALISRGSVEANRSKASEQGITQVLLQQDREIATAYQAYGTPSMVLIHADGSIGSPLAQGADAIRVLVAQAVGLPALRMLPAAAPSNVQPASQPAVLRLGEPAPAFSLPDLSGQTVHMADLRGQKTLILFWNPDCGFCERMLNNLKDWETRTHHGAPKLLVVSTGTVEANQALGLRSLIVLDQNMSVGSRFGANGTPMAVLVDAEGRIASEVAAGAQSVLALAGHQQNTVAPA